MDNLHFINQQAMPLDYSIKIGDCEYIASVQAMTLNGAFLAYPQQVPPDCVEGISKIAVFFQQEWQTLSCQVVYAAKVENGVFPYGFAVTFLEDDAS